MFLVETAGRIFMISSVADSNNIYRRFLEQQDYEVFVTDNPYKLIKYADELRPSLYILDAATANVNMWEVLRYLKEQRYTAEAPAVVLNVAADSRLEKGAAHYLPPHASPNRLSAIAKAYIQGGSRYKMLLLDDCLPANGKQLRRFGRLPVSYFKVHDCNAADNFLHHNHPALVAVHSRAEDYAGIRDFLGYEQTFYIENQHNIKELFAILQ